jgi:hypothetical protein
MLGASQVLAKWKSEKLRAHLVPFFHAMKTSESKKPNKRLEATRAKPLAPQAKRWA